MANWTLYKTSGIDIGVNSNQINWNDVVAEILALQNTNILWKDKIFDSISMITELNSNIFENCEFTNINFSGAVYVACQFKQCKFTECSFNSNDFSGFILKEWLEK